MKRRTVATLIPLLLVACGIAVITGPSATPTTPTVPSFDPSIACRYQAPLPDPACTPGATNPAVTQTSIHQTICVSGWTKTVRPPISYTEPLKRQQIAQYGYADTNPADYEEDHYIPLELGGHPTDPHNLWPQPHPASSAKDLVENRLHAQVCSGQITLDQAQQAIRSDWTRA